jgi:predicted RNase H-like HicB family nuclease
LGVSQGPLHVAVHYEDRGYWAEVKELPGCFATGDTLDELTVSLEEAIGLYLMPSGEPEEPRREDLEGEEVDVEPIEAGRLEDYGVGELELAPRAVRLKVVEMQLTVEPLLPPTGWDITYTRMAQPSQREDPHQQWHLRGFHRRGDR